MCVLMYTAFHIQHHRPRELAQVGLLSRTAEIYTKEARLREREIYREGLSGAWRGGGSGSGEIGHVRRRSLLQLTSDEHEEEK